MDDTTIGTPVGPYGTVIEHPLIRGLFYMVIGPCDFPGRDDFWGIVLNDISGFSYKQQAGSHIVLGGYHQSGVYSDWIVVE